MKELVAVLLASAVLLIGSIGFAQQEDHPSSIAYQREKVYEPLSKAPAKIVAKRNPMEKDADAVAAGQNLFEQHCAECHGTAGDGSKKAPSLRAGEVQSAAPGAIFWILTNGVVRRGMPVWSKLPEPQRWQLVSFIKSLGASPNSPDKKSP
jgi:mono/diheme cytochrome c family protein